MPLLHDQFWVYYFAPESGAKYYYKCVCRLHISKTTRPNLNNFCAFCLWPWLGDPLALCSSEKH